MKFMVIIAVVGAAAAAVPFRTSYSAPGGGRYVVTQDNSFEYGVRDTSLEYVRNVGDLANVGAAGGPVSVKSATDNQLQNFPYAIGLDSSEEVMFHAGELGDLNGRTRSARVKTLSHMLNSGYVDASDELRFRSNFARATALGGKNYYINDSGELFYREGTGALHAGPSAAAGQGVQVA
ncbi:uncharacterized protein LOC125036728 isoform X1 [Penaeus chinensis]|uniref:uncharacterized protein LOC125036728 isoform X1 n=1 Tax=Penaeus chinensis TaxID=139456 RepID=UPI001FB5FAD7|nr:uncharacterized protein LOC125036728 isoform X1 [Penaeus chinensis]